MGKMIYLDNAATTKTAPEVVQADRKSTRLNSSHRL